MRNIEKKTEDAIRNGIIQGKIRQKRNKKIKVRIIAITATIFIGISIISVPKISEAGGIIPAISNLLDSKESNESRFDPTTNVLMKKLETNGQFQEQTVNKELNGYKVEVKGILTTAGLVGVTYDIYGKELSNSYLKSLNHSNLAEIFENNSNKATLDTPTSIKKVGENHYRGLTTLVPNQEWSKDILFDFKLTLPEKTDFRFYNLVAKTSGIRSFTLNKTVKYTQNATRKDMTAKLSSIDLGSETMLVNYQNIFNPKDLSDKQRQRAIYSWISSAEVLNKDGEKLGDLDLLVGGDTRDTIKEPVIWTARSRSVFSLTYNDGERLSELPKDTQLKFKFEVVGNDDNPRQDAASFDILLKDLNL